ncbi:MAG: C25 family cysteine peptidase [candidate division WOR-3 bacterium]|nr:C25 family cysteine peptidase [candidate division WOR-3 bacterium]
MKTRNIFLGFVLLMNFCLGAGARYLIITHDNFYNAIKPLAEWKQRKGIPTKIVKLSDIGASPSNISVIKNYIVNAYNTWNPRPEYVLLVGSGSYIAAENSSYDDYYGNVSGDYKMELAVGRFPVTSVTQCSVLVRKTLGYERSPYMTDTLWFRKGTTIVREGGDEDDTVYWNDARYTHNLWRQVPYLRIDSLSSARGSNSNSVTSAINDGRAYVLYRGTATVNWYQPFQNINPSNLTNGYKLPVIVSATCATMSLFYDDYLGNRFMNAGTTTNPRGSVAFLGTTVSATGTGLARLRGAVVQQFFKAVFVERIYRLGDAFKRAKFVLDSLALPGYNQTRYREWNLFGDPELNLWTTKPQRLTVICDTNVTTVPQNYTITVRNSVNSLPIANALVCVMMDTLIYQYGYTNAQGQITFFINPPHPDSMYITVTAPNYIPYEKDIYVRYGQLTHDVGVSEILEPQGTIHTQMSVIPKVRIKNYGSARDTISVTLKIGNLYQQTINNIVLGSNETLTISFPGWTPVYGYYSVVAYTNLASDQYRGNDTAVAGVLVNRAVDIGIDSIISPQTSHYNNSPVNPTILVKNYGMLNQTNFVVTCSIIHQSGNLVYSSIKTVPSLLAFDTVRVVFDTWRPNITGACTVKFRTTLVGDENPQNDRALRITGIMAGVSDELTNKPEKLELRLRSKVLSKNCVALEFYLPQNTYLDLAVYDACGSLVKELTRGNFSQGRHVITWSNEVPGGIYFCTLTTKLGKRTQKIILSH